MRTRNLMKLPRCIHRWADEAELNDKGYSDKQVWRIDEFLEGRWSLFGRMALQRNLRLEMQGDRYRLATVKTHELVLN